MSTRKGLIIKNTGSHYTVCDTASGAMSDCRLRGAFRLKGIKTTNPVAVGDVVEYDPQEGAITGVCERKNYVIRRSSNLSRQGHIIAANIDRAFLVVTIDHPKTSYEFIDRFLLSCEMYKIPVSLVLNKCDLYNDDEHIAAVEEFLETYDLAGYEVVRISALYNEGLDRLLELIRNKVSLFAGNSGVGKSTLINAIDPALVTRTAEISEYHNRGRHTTTYSEMFPLTGGGYLIDTPGIKGFGLIDVEKDEICRYFPDLFKYAPQCKFYNCTHTHEPDCAVQQALDEGAVSPNRYISYLKTLDDDDGKYRR